MILILKVIAIILAAISVSKSYIDFRKKKESFVMFLFWALVWIVATAVIVYPHFLDEFINLTKDSSITIGSLTGFAFLFMLYIVYRVYAKAERIEYQLTELTRKLALDKTKSES